MKKSLTVFLVLALSMSTASISAQESNPPKHTAQRGDAAGYGTKDATILSMMGWGVGLAVGIALLCGYMDHDHGHAH
jgi:hypothetical protein